MPINELEPDLNVHAPNILTPASTTKHGMGVKHAPCVRALCVVCTRDVVVGHPRRLHAPCK